MLKSSLYLPVIAALMVLSISCRLIGEILTADQERSLQPTATIEASVASDTPKAAVITPEVELVATFHATVESLPPTPSGEVPLVGGFPPQSNATMIQPSEGRAELTRLSNLLGLQVIDYFGAPMGTVVDYVINTCETYIIYLLVDPVDALQPGTARYPVIPFEALTINSGVLDATAKTMRLHVTAEKISASPTFPGPMDLVPPVWEPDIRDYWSQFFRLGKLTTECVVSQPGSGGTEKMVIHKVAYATHLIGAPLQDGLQNPLGSVVEGILEPESGKLGFIVVQLNQAGENVLVPLSVVNIPEWALEPGSPTTLVLLKETFMLENAPRISSIELASDPAVQQTAREYWRR